MQLDDDVGRVASAVPVLICILIILCRLPDLPLHCNSSGSGFNPQGVVTYILPVKVFATGIKNLGLSLIT